MPQDYLTSSLFGSSAIGIGRSLTIPSFYTTRHLGLFMAVRCGSMLRLKANLICFIYMMDLFDSQGHFFHDGSTITIARIYPACCAEGSPVQARSILSQKCVSVVKIRR